MRKAQYLVSLTLAAVFTAAGADDTTARLGKATAVLNKMTQSGDRETIREDPNLKIVFYGHTTGAFAGFDLDGATLKPDDSGNKALYGKTLSNGEIFAGATAPSIAQTFVATIVQVSNR